MIIAQCVGHLNFKDVAARLKIPQGDDIRPPDVRPGSRIGISHPVSEVEHRGEPGRFNRQYDFNAVTRIIQGQFIRIKQCIGLLQPKQTRFPDAELRQVRRIYNRIRMKNNVPALRTGIHITAGEGVQGKNSSFLQTKFMSECLQPEIFGVQPEKPALINTPKVAV